MFNLDKFISDSVTFRPSSMFEPDIKANAEALTREIKGKKVCVIGGAGSIGSSFIKAVLRFEPKSVVVVDLNENGLAELVRDVRSTNGLYVPDEFRCYTLNFADPIFERIFREEKGFDIVANFSAHKHVRSEKDRYSVQALIENNDIKAKKLMDLLTVYPPKHFFCVSTDKAANPVNIMGASKRIMEDLVMAYNDKFKVTTALRSPVRSVCWLASLARVAKCSFLSWVKTRCSPSAAFAMSSLSQRALRRKNVPTMQKPNSMQPGWTTTTTPIPWSISRATPPARKPTRSSMSPEKKSIWTASKLLV